MVAHQQTANIQKLLCSLWRFHTIRSRFQDGAILIAQAAEETEAEHDGERSVLLGQVLTQQGSYCTHFGRFEEARESLQQSLKLLRSGAARAGLAHTLAVLAYMKTRLGEFQEAQQHAEESISLNRALGDQDEIAYCLSLLGHIHLAQGAYETAYRLYSEGLAICRDVVGDPPAMAHCLMGLSAAASQLGRYAEAKRWAEEGLEVSTSLNDQWSIGQRLRRLGLISLELGEIERAEILLHQSVSQIREIGGRALVADALVDLGAATCASGAVSEAKQCLLEALSMAIETQTDHTALQALMQIAMIVMSERNTEQAL